MTILDQLADHVRERIAQAKRQCSFAALRAQAEQIPKGTLPLRKAWRSLAYALSVNAKRHRLLIDALEKYKRAK